MLILLDKISISKDGYIVCLVAEKIFLSPLFIVQTVSEAGISHNPFILNFKGSAGSSIIVTEYDAAPVGLQFSVSVHAPSYFIFAFSSFFLQEVIEIKRINRMLRIENFVFIIFGV